MLTAAAISAFKFQFNSTVAAVGVSAVWSRAKAPTPTKTITVGYKTAGVKDTDVINSYGINAIVLTVRAADVAVAPEKFDSFTINGVRHTADAATPVNLKGEVIGWKVYVRGTN